MLKILQARLQKYMNRELPDVQAGFKKGRGIRDHQIANICWITEKVTQFQNNYFCFTDYTKAFVWITTNSGKFLEMGIPDHRPPYLSPEKLICRTRSNSYNQTWNNRLVQNSERYVKAEYSHPAYLTSMHYVICRAG